MKNVYEMYTPAGDRACDALVKRITKKIQGKKRVTAKQIFEMVEKGMEKIGVKHPEVDDTEPRWHIKDYVDKAMVDNDYQKVFERY
jgi:hypothetical protein